MGQKLATICTDVRSAHKRIDQTVSSKLFTWIIGGLCAAFIITLSILIHQFAEQQTLTNAMDSKLNILVYQVSQIEKRTEQDGN